jgi:low affinity Fe/Cu permease
MAARGGWLERMSRRATEWTGSSLAFALALGTVIVWVATGPLFSFSDTWQLVINTGTTIVTFLMVFLIQEVKMLRDHFRKLVELAKRDEDFTCVHSIEEAEAEHTRKKASREIQKLDKVLRKKRRKRRAKNSTGDAPNDKTATDKPA